MHLVSFGPASLILNLSCQSPENQPLNNMFRGHPKNAVRSNASNAEHSFHQNPRLTSLFFSLRVLFLLSLIVSHKLVLPFHEYFGD